MRFDYSRWCRVALWLLAWSAFGEAGGGRTVLAQESAAQTAPPAAMSETQMEKRLQEVSDLLQQTRRQLEQSREQMNALTVELEAMRKQVAATPVEGGAASLSSSTTAASSATAASTLAETVTRMGEEQEAQQAEIRQHEQTKVETESKYALRVQGLVLFNAFANDGVVDNVTAPSIALPRLAGTSHGSLGATMRQTILGLHGTGPVVFGARSSADVNVDFFGNASYSFYGNAAGSVRLRTADVGLDWRRDALHMGVDAPLISPNSPDSYATVGLPALAWAGNLWSWSTQLRYKHSVAWGERRALELEGGLWDAPVVGLKATTVAPVPSPGELSRRPGLEGRLAYRGGDEENAVVLGVGGYSGEGRYDGNFNVHTWAVTGDWKIPLTHRFAVSGEIYRGVGLGGFGGGAYKDVLIGMDPVTDTTRTIGLDAAGGWSQIKAKLLPSLELNAAYGQDGGFAADFRKLELYVNFYPLETSARNRMVFGNLVYRPKTYLIFSPEYRRIDSWQITGAPNVANVFTLSAGYQF
jgi:uncharacterized coiled-coil protein SlyX